jgi:hypothetical protein
LIILLNFFHSYLRNHNLIYDKIKNAKTSDWLSEGLTEDEIKEAISEAKTERDKERKGIFTLIRARRKTGPDPLKRRALTHGHNRPVPPAGEH